LRRLRKALREDEFTRGQARFLDNRPWCAECRPPDKNPILAAAPAQGARKSGSSAKHPRVTAPPPLPAVDESKKAKLIGVGVAVVGVLVLGLVLTGRPSPDSRRPADPPPAIPSSGDAEQLIKDLEAFASDASPDRILARCDELRPRFRGKPQERRFQAIEKLAHSRELELQFSRGLDGLQRIIDEDGRYARYDDVVRRFKAAKAIAGARAAEVERRLAEYELLRKTSPHEKHLGPFASDEQGYLRHWLVLGAFPNDKDQGIDVDFLGGEAAHDLDANRTEGIEVERRALRRADELR